MSSQHYFGGLHYEGVDSETLVDISGKAISVHRQEAFLTLTGRLDVAKQNKLGHQLSTMLLSCTWHGHRCTVRSVG